MRLNVYRCALLAMMLMLMAMPISGQEATPEVTPETTPEATPVIQPTTAPVAPQPTIIVEPTEASSNDHITTMIVSLTVIVGLMSAVYMNITGKSIDAARDGIPQWAISALGSGASYLAEQTPSPDDDIAVEKMMERLGRTRIIIEGREVWVSQQDAQILVATGPGRWPAAAGKPPDDPTKRFDDDFTPPARPDWMKE